MNARNVSAPALAAALGLDNDYGWIGPFVCARGCSGAVRILEYDESHTWVCPSCRSLLVPQAIADAPAARERYARAVLGGANPLARAAGLDEYA